MKISGLFLFLLLLVLFVLRLLWLLLIHAVHHGKCSRVAGLHDANARDEFGEKFFGRNGAQNSLLLKECVLIREEIHRHSRRGISFRIIIIIVFRWRSQIITSVIIHRVLE